MAGPPAIQAKIEAERSKELSRVIPEKVHGIAGVEDTLALIAFEASKEHRVNDREEAKKLAEEGAWESFMSSAEIVSSLNFAPMGRE